jgi:hypothetical protein
VPIFAIHTVLLIIYTSTDACVWHRISRILFDVFVSISVIMRRNRVWFYSFDVTNDVRLIMFNNWWSGGCSGYVMWRCHQNHGIITANTWCCYLSSWATPSMYMMRQVFWHVCTYITCDVLYACRCCRQSWPWEGEAGIRCKRCGVL